VTRLNEQFKKEETSLNWLWGVLTGEKSVCKYEKLGCKYEKSAAHICANMSWKKKNWSFERIFAYTLNRACKYTLKTTQNYFFFFS
jgi:hypothetical protein